MTRTLTALLGLTLCACAMDPLVEPPAIHLAWTETLYELEATRVEGKTELARVRTLYYEKYGTEADEWGFWRTEASPWVYRLDPR